MKKLLLLLLLFTSSFIYSQDVIEINSVREGYYQIYNADSVKIDQKATELEAMQGLINYQFSSGLIGYFVPPPFRVDITGQATVTQIEIDTLTITGRWHMTGDGGNYYRYPEYGDIIKIEADTVMSWQKEIEVIRTKSFGKTEYKDTGIIPFQVSDAYIYDQVDNTAKAHVNITKKQSKIIAYLDNVWYKEWNPGYSVKLTEDDYWFWFNISILEPNNEYILRVEVTSIDGDINFVELKIVN